MVNNIPFIIMDYAPNGSLRDRYPHGTVVPLESVVSYVNQVASALQYMHDEKLIHRNVQPGAMLVGRKNEILLGGFSFIWSVIGEGVRLAGSPVYMAPEQIQGKPRPASDQYVLAAVVYEWLAGKPLFEGSFTEVISQHIASPPLPVRDRIPLIPPTVEQVILKALAKEPYDRFPSILSFAQALAESSYLAQNINPYSYGWTPTISSSSPKPASIKPSQPQYGSSPTLMTPSYPPYQQPRPHQQSEVTPSYPPPPPPQLPARRFLSISRRGMLVSLIALITIASVEVIAYGRVAQLLQSPILLVGLVGLIAIAVMGVIVKTRFK